MSVSRPAIGRPVVPKDERVARTGSLRRLLVRPEMGALAGAIAVWLFFVIVAGRNGFLSLAGAATYLQVAAELGILAVAVALLMIGGEFDLSVGSILGATGMIVTALAVQFNWNIWLAMAAAMGFALLIGFFNGYLVLRTGLPSFIVTLGTLYIIRGATIAATRLLTGRTQIGGLDKAPGFDTAQAVFASTVSIGGSRFSISILWWLLVAAVATWILLRTSFGNWIFGCGATSRPPATSACPSTGSRSPCSWLPPPPLAWWPSSRP